MDFGSVGRDDSTDRYLYSVGFADSDESDAGEENEISASASAPSQSRSPSASPSPKASPARERSFDYTTLSLNPRQDADAGAEAAGTNGPPVTLAEHLHLDAQRFIGASEFVFREDGVNAGPPRRPTMAPGILRSASPQRQRMDLDGAQPPLPGVGASSAVRQPVTHPVFHGTGRPAKPAAPLRKPLVPSQPPPCLATSAVYENCVRGDLDRNAVARAKPEIMFGRSFRVGWGPNGKLLIPSFASLRRAVEAPKDGATAPEGGAAAPQRSTDGAFVAHRVAATMFPQPEYLDAIYGPSLRTSLLSASMVGPEVRHAQNIGLGATQQAVPGATALIRRFVAASREEQVAHRKLFRRLRKDPRSVYIRQPLPQSSPDSPPGQLIEASAAGVLSWAAAEYVAIWELVLALWGNDDFDKTGEPTVLGGVEAEQRRRVRLQNWLSKDAVLRVRHNLNQQDGTTSSMQVDAEQATGELQGPLRWLWLLSGGQLRQAAEEARRSDPRLAAVITSPAQTRQRFMRQQLTAWRDKNTPVEKARKAVYRLLAGDILVLLEESNHQIDWRRYFSCFLLYGEISTARSAAGAVRPLGELTLGDLATAFSEYTLVFAQRCEANPSYFEELRLVAERAARSTQASWITSWGASCARALGARNSDLCYHLVQLAAFPAAQRGEAGKMLQPLTITLNPLDFRLVWHLGIFLRDIGELPEDCVGLRRATAGFAAQLEDEGLWEWAAYVLLHLPSALRDRALEQLLRRHLHKLSRQPRAVLHEALAFVKMSFDFEDLWAECAQVMDRYLLCKQPPQPPRRPLRRNCVMAEHIRLSREVEALLVAQRAS
eukprot:TRINITY_DN7577_c0_g1_i1.p1 TRINITY_DN7577_c0_g1~~TRINITY_DN7577_c0_g1_i1.p1  ORF type:complete len:830 (+),score=112.37 TRINITY_DN7577_c0_g1_i1:102-2591(+)